MSECIDQQDIIFGITTLGNIARLDFFRNKESAKVNTKLLLRYIFLFHDEKRPINR